MKTFKYALLVFALIALISGLGNAQEPLDGRHRTFNDELLENLVGDWKLTRLSLSNFRNTNP
jgi:hypothetical protein